MAGRLSLVPIVLATSLALAHEPGKTKYTYNQHVFPILRKHCGQCHISGGIGPMSLIRYDEASPWTASIKTEILERRMPPWLPDESSVEFQGARSLSAEEIDIIVDWATGGAPAGDPVELPTSLPADGPAKLGNPDLVLQPETETAISADRMKETRCVVLPTRLRKPRWVRAFEFLPGNPEIVHGAVITLGNTCSSDNRPLAAWLPGEMPFVLPAGIGEPLPAGASLALQIHYRKTWRHDGKEMKDRSRLQLYFDKASAPVRSIRLHGTPIRLSQDIKVLSVFAAAAEGKSVEVEALQPDGKRAPLLMISNYDPAWQTKYVFTRPVTLPKGTTVRSSLPAVWLDYVQ